MKLLSCSKWLLFVVLFFTRVSVCSAAEVHLDPAWDIMNRAWISFEQGELGTALALCEDARTLHEKVISGYVQQLNTSITPTVLQDSGGEILLARKLLAERNESEAVMIIDMVLRVYHEKDFNNSIDELVQWLEKRAAYPEVDILSGDVYSAEGEYDLAREFYLNAWQQRTFLKIPGDRFELCYRLADIARIMGNYGEQEQYLLLILTEDPVFGTPGEESASLIAMKRTLQTADDAEKFFSLYRHQNTIALKAYQDLTKFYYFHSGKRLAPAFSTATLASVISITLLDDFLTRKLVDYRFTTFEDLLKKSAVFPEIIKEAERLGVWESFIDLAIILNDSGYYGPSHSILRDISTACADQAVAHKARGLLEKML